MYFISLFLICWFIYLFTHIYRYSLLARADAMDALVNGYDSCSNALRDIHNRLAIILKQDMNLGYLGTKWTVWRQFCWLRSGIHYLYGSTTRIKFSKALMFTWKKDGWSYAFPWKVSKITWGKIWRTGARGQEFMW